MAAAMGRAGSTKDNGKHPPNFNRFAALSRDRSVSATRIPVTPTSKRPPEDLDLPNSKLPRVDNNSVFKDLASTEVKLAMIQQTITKTKETLMGATVDGVLSGILGGILDALEGIVETQVGISSALVDGLGLLGGKAKGGGGPAKGNDGSAAGGGTATVAKPPPTAEEVRKKKFVAAVREAEKSVLIFNLDLGSVPVMNTSTISMKVTQDLSAKAAAVEGKDSGRPSEEGVTVLDDVLSMVKGMEFFGKATKPYTNRMKADDPKNGTYCTIPVKMAFKDKDTRSSAEAILRSKCKVQCTTPYHPSLRNAIKAVLTEEKGKFDKQFVQVRVDPEAFCLKVSRKAGDNWINNYLLVPLDDKVMDLGYAKRSGAPETMDTEVADPSTL